ncbi:MAG: hypothetical protein NVSMB1_01750 [Polyangiales bacterium]
MSSLKTLFGCGGFRGPLSAYARRFAAIELDVFDKQPAIKLATLKKWRKDAGPALEFSLVAPRVLAALRPSAALDEALAQLVEAQRLLQARFLVLSTPTEVTPAPLPRERLTSVVARLREGLAEARALVRIVWEPHGVWEQEAAAAFATQLEMDLCTDPLADPREPFFHNSMRYFRFRTVGGRTEFPPARLRALGELLAAAQGDDERAKRASARVVIFQTPHAAVEVKRLRTLVRQLSEHEGSESGGLVITPRRRPIDDDEEE